MANKMKLSEADELLRRYRSERRVLGFQMNKLRMAIKELRRIRSAAEKEEAARMKRLGIPKRGPGRPRKNPLPPGVEAPERKRKGRPGRRKKKPGEGPALNQWDNAVISSITTSDRLLPKAEIMDHVKAWARKNEPALKAPEVEAFVTRSLQKLSTGKVKNLGAHHTGLQRGNHYGLIKWFFASSGKLRGSALDKLHIEKG
ncbi:MAG: hypothetical protein ABI599_17415 [Flavobacteriales bacterium]